MYSSLFSRTLNIDQRLLPKKSTNLQINLPTISSPIRSSDNRPQHSREALVMPHQPHILRVARHWQHRSTRGEGQHYRRREKPTTRVATQSKVLTLSALCCDLSWYAHTAEASNHRSFRIVPRLKVFANRNKVIMGDYSEIEGRLKGSQTRLLSL